MVSYAVTGATRGIGFGFVDNISSDPKNQVFALIRSKASAGPLEDLASKRGNIHIIVTDIASPTKLAEAAAEVSKVSGGSLDILILNAGSAGPETSSLPPTAFHGKPEALEHEINENMKNNLFSNIYVIEAFLELIRKGQEKKIAFVSSSSGDVEFTRITGISAVVGYSIAKAGMNMVITKYAVELAGEGIKTLSISPGWVATDAAQAITGDPEIRKFFLDAFHKLDPTVTGPIPVEESVAAQLKLVHELSAKDSGKFVTHRGNSEWF